MEINYNVTGAERKKLVEAVAEILGRDSKYLGAPSFAYEVDYFTIDKNGVMSFDDRADSEEVEGLIEALASKGFTAADEGVNKDDGNNIGLCIELPLDGATDATVENLRRLVASKGNMIKKALGADSLDIELTNNTIKFPWFSETPEVEVVSAAAKLIGKLVGMARTQKRVTAKEKETDNEKYTFRCFLLRLGFIGSEYKAARKLLLRNLSGSSAFKNGARKNTSADGNPGDAPATTDPTVVSDTPIAADTTAADDEDAEAQA